MCNSNNNNIITVHIHLPSFSYLGNNVSKVDGLLEMAHHHEVPGLVPTVVESLVVDVTENGTSTDPLV